MVFVSTPEDRFIDYISDRAKEDVLKDIRLTLKHGTNISIDGLDRRIIHSFNSLVEEWRQCYYDAYLEERERIIHNFFSEKGE